MSGARSAKNRLHSDPAAASRTQPLRGSIRARASRSNSQPPSEWRQDRCLLGQHCQENQNAVASGRSSRYALKAPESKSRRGQIHLRQ